MTQKLILGIAITFAIAACTGESKKLQSQVDSLKNELQTSQQFSKTLEEVGVLMDSIDANRQLLRVNMVEGTTYDDYTSRMKGINNYVKDTQSKIEELEKSLKKSKGNANAYAATIKKLKADLEEKSKEISSLQNRVDTLTTQNKDLIKTRDLQDAEIADKESEIAAKTQELSLIEAKIEQLMVSSKMSEADSYFARAQAIEEAANRTKLAPKKKKNTLKEALELYKKAQSLGNDKAQAKIDELTKKTS
jgi:chromosome segregation ATPase